MSNSEQNPPASDGGWRPDPASGSFGTGASSADPYPSVWTPPSTDAASGPAPTRAAAPPTHGAATPTHGAATPTHGAATPTHGAATPTHGAATPTHGAATPTYAPIDEPAHPAHPAHPLQGVYYAPANTAPIGVTPQPTTQSASAIVLTIVSALLTLSCYFTLVGIAPLVLGIIALSKQQSDLTGARRLARTGWIVLAVIGAVYVLTIVAAGILFFGLALPGAGY